jgi:subtilisin family serine protease
MNEALAEVSEDVDKAFKPVIAAPRPTGRRLVKFKKSVELSDMRSILSEASGVPVFSTADLAHSLEAAQLSASGAATVVLDRFSIAAIGGGSGEASSAAERLEATGAVEDSRPEFWMFAIDGPPWVDVADATWGLAATRAASSAYDGAGIRLAVLDTGFDAGHPDFQASRITYQSFVEGQSIQDVQGHGTHTTGTAAGRAPHSPNLPRYGVAPGADLYVGKVLNDSGAGRELDIIAGIAWALDNECQVISLSLGRMVQPDEQYDPMYEDIAAQALEEGCLIVAAAGNDSDRRYGYVAPVGAPANAPSVLAVAAVGADGRVATFSCGGVGTGQVDISAPGVGVFSAFPAPQLYKGLSGTSMACPHVAGIAALWAQKDPALRGRLLWDALLANSAGLPEHNYVDLGQGLVQAP